MYFQDNSSFTAFSLIIKVICVHCNNLYLVFFSPEHSYLRYYLHGLLRPFLQVLLKSYILREAFLPMFLNNNLLRNSLLLTLLYFFSTAPITILYMPASSLPPSTRVEFIYFVLCLFICLADHS